MKLPVFFKVAAKYLWRYRRRYLFLFFTLGFCFGVVTVISSIKDGMKENLYLSAQSHYAGDIIAIGYNPETSINHHLTTSEIDQILASTEAVGLNPLSTAIRTSLQGKNEGSIYFNGNAFPLKYIVGVDWHRESGYFDKLFYTSTPEEPEENSIIISSPIARELGALQGDRLTLEVLTATGQKNTGSFVVAGIADDTSFFGYYKVYISRLSLNRLIGFADGESSLVGFFIEDSASIEKYRDALFNELSTRITMGPLVYDRQSYNDETNKIEEGTSTFLLTLPVHLSEVSQLLDAIDLASYVLFAMMLAIIMVSAGVTCRLILHERKKESGTMRAIGFYESDVRFIFKLEIFTMALVSMAAGFILSLFINWLLSYTSLSWFPGFEVFMRNGRLNALYLPKTIATNVLSVFCILALAVWGPVFRNSRNPMPEMLSGGAV
jgi:ABC-type lipoprotein release transport system permease subunit